MKKKLNENLIKALITTNFLTVESYNTLNKLRHTNNVLITNSNSMKTLSLDVLELLKSLKQFIRILQFLKGQKSKCLQIGTSNKHTSDLLNLYLKEISINTKIEVKNSLRKTKSNLNTTNILFLIEEPLHNNKNVFKRLLEENILIVNKLNTKIESNNWSTYKIYNDVADFKKLVFIISLINQSLR